MAQAYRTTYNINYRWRDTKGRLPSLPPRDKFAESLPSGDYWIVKKTIEEGIDQAAIDAVQRLYDKRYVSTYQNEFCTEKKMCGDNVPSALLEYGSDLYSAKTVKLLPPLPSAKRLYGFLSPANMFTPLTTYQFHIGKLGYSILKSNKPKPVEKSEKNDEDAKLVIKETKKEEVKNKDKVASVNTTPRAKTQKNYVVSYNGKDITINKSYDTKTHKIICQCK